MSKDKKKPEQAAPQEQAPQTEPAVECGEAVQPETPEAGEETTEPETPETGEEVTEPETPEITETTEPEQPEATEPAETPETPEIPEAETTLPDEAVSVATTLEPGVTLLVSNGKGNSDKKDPDKPTGSDVKKTSTVVKQFVVDYTTETFEPLMEHEVNGLDYKYVYGNDRLSVDIWSVNNSGSIVENGDHIRLYYHMDYLGTADYLTSPVSLRVEAWTHYNEWGEITHNAVLNCGQRELDLVKRYATHDYDAVLDLYYAKARMYDAERRQFNSVDPILDPSVYDLKTYTDDPVQFVQYLYVQNQPLVYIDPLGEYYLILLPDGTYVFEPEDKWDAIISVGSEVMPFGSWLLMTGQELRRIDKSSSGVYDVDVTYLFTIVKDSSEIMNIKLQMLNVDLDILPEFAKSAGKGVSIIGAALTVYGVAESASAAAERLREDSQATEILKRLGYSGTFSNIEEAKDILNPIYNQLRNNSYYFGYVTYLTCGDKYSNYMPKFPSMWEIGLKAVTLSDAQYEEYVDGIVEKYRAEISNAVKEYSNNRAIYFTVYEQQQLVKIFRDSLDKENMIGRWNNELNRIRSEIEQNQKW